MTDALLKLFQARAARAADDEVLAFREAMTGVPEINRSVVEIVDLEGRSYEDAAAELQVPIGTIRSRRHRAIELLRKLLPAPSPCS